VVVIVLAVLAACARVPPAELVRTTPFTLARERGRFVEVHGLRLFAITLGDGRDVVLIHGNGASTYSWRHVLEPLAARYRVHALDLPGYGFSDKPEDGRYDGVWLEEFLSGYLDVAGVRRAVLVGNSMGGEVATEAAMHDPARVAALVLLDAGGLPEAHADGVPLSHRMLTWPVIGPVLQRLPVRGRLAARLREAVYDPDTITDTDVDVYYAAFASAGGGNAFLARLRAQPGDRSARVATIATPTLVVTGDSDRLVPPATARRYHELVRGSELIVLEQTGHLPQEERPERVVGEVVRWTDAHP
jgi:pimeloyl-ACP methyl ester carboxylesterase